MKKIAGFPKIKELRNFGTLPAKKNVCVLTRASRL